MNWPKILVEIYCEELPARESANLLDQWMVQWVRILDRKGLKLTHFRGFVTPSRLAILLEALELDSQWTLRTGPSREAAFLPNQDEWSPAAKAWAASLGLDLKQAQWVQKGKTEVLALPISLDAKSFQAELPALIEETILAIPLQKKMRWTIGPNSISFIRPIRSVAALWGDQKLQGQVFGLEIVDSTDVDPPFCTKRVQLTDAERYVEVLSDQGIAVDMAQRRGKIIQQMKSFEEEYGIKVQCNSDLLEECVHLTERPEGILGRFPERYLVLPKPLIQHTLNHHQKAFTIENSKGSDLLPLFFAVVQNASKSGKIQVGYEFVIRSRLEDALFFYQEDLKTSFSDWLTGLTNLNIHEKLGTVSEKNRRVKHLYRHFFGHEESDLDIVWRGIDLAKCDLNSQVVTEIPALSGVMGAHYARLAEEAPRVIAMIEQHSWPKQMDDPLPKDIAACRFALLDKLDSVVGLIGVGAHPRANADPFAVRRNALGVLRILMDGALEDDLDLSHLTQASAAAYAENQLSDDVIEETLNFFRARLKFFLQKKGFCPKIVQAFLVQQELRPAHLLRQIESFTEPSIQKKVKQILQADKRIRQLLQSQKIAESDFILDSLDSLLSRTQNTDAKRNLSYAARTLLDDCLDFEKNRPLFLEEYAKYWDQLGGLAQKVETFLEKTYIAEAQPDLRQIYLNLLLRSSFLFNSYLKCKLL